jgi:hypothetical protein
MLTMTIIRLDKVAYISFFACITVLLLNSCSTLDSPKAREEVGQSTPASPHRSFADTDLENIASVLTQLKQMNEQEKKDAQLIIADIEEMMKGSQWNWSGVSKQYAEAAIRVPSPINLSKAAQSLAMINRDSEPSNRQETLSIKLKDWKRAVNIYKVALEVSKQPGQSLPSSKSKAIQGDIRCLESFIKKPDLKMPPCPLIKDALEVSKESYKNKLRNLLNLQLRKKIA